MCMCVCRVLCPIPGCGAECSSVLFIRESSNCGEGAAIAAAGSCSGKVGCGGRLRATGSTAADPNAAAAATAAETVTGARVWEEVMRMEDWRRTRSLAAAAAAAHSFQSGSAATRLRGPRVH